MNVLVYIDKELFDKKMPGGGFADTTRYLAEHLKKQDLSVTYSFLPDADLARNFDVVLPRFNPPNTNNGALARYESFLEDLSEVEQEYSQILFVNSPKSMLANIEKDYLELFPKLTGNTLFAKTLEQVNEFLADQKDKYTILKPRGGMGGTGIEKIRYDTSNLDEFVKNYFEEYAARDGSIIVQDFNPLITQTGDKRINVFNGEAISGYIRRAQEGSYKSNMSAGGTAHQSVLEDRDLFIVDQLSSYLKDNGLFYVGVDVAGGKLLEINLLSPGGAVRTDAFENEPRTAHAFYNSLLNAR